MVPRETVPDQMFLKRVSCLLLPRQWVESLWKHPRKQAGRLLQKPVGKLAYHRAFQFRFQNLVAGSFFFFEDGKAKSMVQVSDLAGAFSGVFAPGRVNSCRAARRLGRSQHGSGMLPTFGAG